MRAHILFQMLNIGCLSMKLMYKVSSCYVIRLIFVLGEKLDFSKTYPELEATAEKVRDHLKGKDGEKCVS